MKDTAKTDIIPLERLTERVSQILEDEKWRNKRARSPQSKRQSKAAMKFWTSIHHHLTKNSK